MVRPAVTNTDTDVDTDTGTDNIGCCMLHGYTANTLISEDGCAKHSPHKGQCVHLEDVLLCDQILGSQQAAV